MHCGAYWLPLAHINRLIGTYTSKIHTKTGFPMMLNIDVNGKQFYYFHCPSFLDGVNSYRKEFAPFRVEPFMEGFSYSGTRKSQNVISLSKTATSLSKLVEK